MTHNKKADRVKQMKIAQLCEESGFKRSTIHYYLNIGLLTPPSKVGLNLSLYDKSHLDQLRRIRHLREREHLPLPVIKEILQRQGAGPEDSPTGFSGSQPVDKKRRRIIKAGTELFSRKGYEKTTISDIADALSMGRGTFYIYFKDKRDLFIECIEQVTMVIVPQEAWKDIRREKDPERRAAIRILAFLKAFPVFRGILNLLRQAMVGEDELLAQKAKDTLRSLIQPLAKDFRRGIQKGAFREVDNELAGYLGFALSEMLGYRLMMDDRYTLEQGLEQLLDYMNHGVLARRTGESMKYAGPQGEVIDRQGVTTRIKGIRFDQTCEFIGRLGEAEVKLELEEIASLQVAGGDAQCLVEVSLLDGQGVALEVDGGVSLSGRTPFGKYSIPLGEVGAVSFYKDSR